MKIYKKIQKAFNGAGLYLDKKMLNHLKVKPGDELIIELAEDKLIITKPVIDITQIMKLINNVSK